ncbi:hypothetical protein Bca101_026754 [Brassica carinata]
MINLLKLKKSTVLSVARRDSMSKGLRNSPLTNYFEVKFNNANSHFSINPSSGGLRYLQEDS